MSRLVAECFARAALQSGCRFSAGLAEARALMATGRPDEAEHVLRDLTAPDARAQTTLTLVRAWNLFWTLDRPTEAEAVLAAGERALGPRSSSGTAERDALRARFAFAQGDPRAALALAAPIEADESAPEAARV